MYEWSWTQCPTVSEDIIEFTDKEFIHAYLEEGHINTGKADLYPEDYSIGELFWKGIEPYP